MDDNTLKKRLEITSKKLGIFERSLTEAVKDKEKMTKLYGSIIYDSILKSFESLIEGLKKEESEYKGQIVL